MISALSPLTYFRRNLGKTLPMAFVIVLSVTMVASVVTIIRSIDLTVFTLYGYNRFLTGMTPRNALVIDDKQVAKVRNLPELGVMVPTHSYTVLVKTIFGKMPFPLFGLDESGRKLLLERCNVRLAKGRLPQDGEPEAVVSDDVARNLGLKLGDIISKPESEDAYAPQPIKLVGLLHGPVWIGLTNKAFVDANSPFTFVGYMAFAPNKDEQAQRRLDSAMEKVVDKKLARVWRFAGLVRETQSALANLYLILNIVTTLIVCAVAFVCALLSNIYFTQRLPEIATLSAIGYGRGQLLRRAFGETVLLCAFGWLMGGILTVSLLYTIFLVALQPKGLLLNPVDAIAFLFTLPMPFAITTFAIVTIWRRLSMLDPVSIIERRG